MLHSERNMKCVSFKPLAKPVDYKGIRVMAVAGLHEILVKTLIGKLPKNSRVLELGCGEGALSQRLADAGYDVLSTDMNKEGFQGETEFRQLDLSNTEQMAEFCAEFSNVSKKFDAVLCVEVIEHMENPWQLVRDIASLARPGGIVLISTPNIGSWYSRGRFFLNGKFPFFYKEDSEYGHIHALSQTELELICHQAGLQVEKFMPGGTLPRLWLSGSILTQVTNLLGFFGSFFMRGIWNGLCIIVVARKS